MAQLDVTEKPLDIIDEDLIPFSATSSSGDRSQTEIGSSGADLSISRSSSFSRLNASAPEFVPRAPSPAPVGGHPRVVKIHHHPPPPAVIHVFHPPPPPPPTVSPQFIPPGPPIGVYEYYGGAIGRGGFGDQESVQAPADSDSTLPAREGLSEDVVQKITKQVEYYFSDANLATTEHLMRFISKDPDGFVPISVVASFKKIKALVHNNFLLANALRTSSKLVISDDGKKVRRLQPFTEADVEELQSRIVVAENLPEDHSYQNLMKIFSAAGSVKTIRTCYPQTPNGTTAPTNRSSKLDMLFCNKLHAFVEYETVEDAERAVAEVNKERNWRSGLRLRLLNKCMQAKHSSGRGRKAGNDGEGAGEEEEVYSNSTNQVDDPSQQAESAFETLGGEEGANEREGGGRRGKARGKGRGRGRVQYHNINNHHRGGGGGHGHGHAIGTPPANNPVHNEQSAAVKQPPVPRMPDGTRGFTMGRGKPSFVASSSSTVTAG
ncbi:la-related protein 6B isoform X1 [Dendrobium catenatum]|uniref:la-related protein 6B isoform X1 n=1 Tax=Dendrobium catenatum TaxID=906689 RepID=UPI0009F37656|nr:la-related protein 6B isoform X1 [Dendrobium catenatum]